MRALVLVAIVAATSPAAAQNAQRSIDRVVAVVNDAMITRSDLDARVAPALRPGSTPAQTAEVTAAVLGEMIDEELVVQAAVAARIEVTSDEVDAALKEIMDQNKLDAAGLSYALQVQGSTLETYKRDLRRQLLRLRAVNQLVAPSVTAKDLKARREALDRETVRWVNKLRAKATIERKL